ncbi:ABC transporter permease [uncultured Ornithinimicrobium sp.]|uniref:ABC transporter permease n=1 Tax=uncultured Ornithinimicrobium sp. TaxID=259307 RepID=UPI0025952C73|nr:ABC transporter permease [uncultured Ornithinimicrobium sp.]
MSAVVAIAVHELKRFLADRFNLFFVLVLPMILVVVLGLQATSQSASSVGVVDGAAGDGAATLTTVLVDQLEAAGLEATAYPDEEELADAVTEGALDVGVVVRSAEPAELEMVAPGEEAPPGLDQLVRGAADSAVVELGRRQALAGAAEVSPDDVAAALARAEEQRDPVTVDVRSTDPVMQEFASMGRFDIGAGGQLLLFVFLNTLTAASATIQARRSGALRRVMAAPVSARQVVAGQALGRFVVAVFQGVYIMAASSLLFGVEWGNLAVVSVVVAVFGLVAAGVALLIGVLMDGEGVASGVAVGVGLVLAALGGSMVPLEFFPETMRRFAYLTPHAWAYEAIAEVQRRGGGLVDVLPQVGVLAGMAAVVLVLGTWALRRSLGRVM